MLLRSIVVGAAALLIASHASAQSFGVDFNSGIGSANPQTISGVTFDSPAPGTFTDANSGLFAGFGAAVGDYASFSGDTLTITFPQAITAPITIGYGLEDAFGTFGSDTLTFTTNLGAVITGTTTLDKLTLAEPEGSVTLAGGGFTSLTVTGANPFAIGALYSVPEPMSFGVLGLALAGLAVIRRRA